jgi:hypothetical protein
MADRSPARVDPVAGRMRRGYGGTHRDRDGSEGHRGALGPVHHGVRTDTRGHRSGAAVARPDCARRPAGEQAGASRDPCVGCGPAHHLIVVTRADGSRPRFVVTEVAQYPKDEFPTARVYANTPGPRRLITCAGHYSPGSHDYSDNVIVYATMPPA